MPSSRHPAPRASRAAVAALVVLVVALAAGCGVRLETPPPPPPVPGVDESARQRAVADAVALRVLAGPVEPAADPVADPVGAARAAVAAAAATHLELLGGPGDDGADPAGPPRGTPAPTPSPTPTPGTPAAVVTGLVEAAGTARADLATVEDRGLARLLASLSASRLLTAARLAAAAGLAPPAVPDIPAPRTVVPGAVPAGVRGGDLATLVAAEDAAGYALEVVAAKHPGDLRARAQARAVVHRGRAQAWAEAGGVDGTGLDPRRPAYALPGDLADPAAAAALVAGLEGTLAADYLSLVAAVQPADRAALADAATEAAAQALAWGAPLPALPGMPEHAGR